MSNQSQQIVSIAWNFAQVLRNDGLSYMAIIRQLFLALVLFSVGSPALYAQMDYQGVKFWVYRTERPGATRLWRICLNDGSHVYTIDQREVDEIVAKREGKVEPMVAYVMQKPGEHLVALRRFATTTTAAGTVRHFYTAFPREAREVGARRATREVKMNAYVFPHDFQPPDDIANEVVPVHWFHNSTSGEHFYTTDNREKSDLLKLATSANSLTIEDDKKIMEASVELATIARNRSVKEHDELAARFADAIRSIRRMYPDTPPKEIAAAIFSSHKQLKEKNKPLPLERVAHLVAAAIPTNQSQRSRIGLADVIAAFTGVYLGGDYANNPDQAARDAKATMEAIVGQGKSSK